MKDRVQAVINKIRPNLAMDGGDIELVDVDVESGIVKVRLKGACAGCPASQMTLKMYVEATMKREVPEVKSVVAV
ncbi:MAG: NifU family protein [Candidatus Eisenbacteria bacterium]|nr:NifU family protein [Candidatus Eisenbacteria bacterium]